ncbi:unnamed protein product [Linum tenue]|nr:unnamed protein product [Linum tenue]
MSVAGSSLSSTTPFLKLRLYVLIGIVAGCVILVCLTVCLCVRLTRESRRRGRMRVKHSSGSIPLVSKEILEIKALDLEASVQTKLACETAVVCGKEDEEIGGSGDKQVGRGNKAAVGGGGGGGGGDVVSGRDVSVEGWGRWYSLKELEIATRGFAEENVIGEGGYGVVYRGVLTDGSVVAVKNLLNNK